LVSEERAQSSLAPVESTVTTNQAERAAAPPAVATVAALERSESIVGEATSPVLRLAPSDGFVLLDGGTFTMGDTLGVGLKYERPSRAMEVGSFYLSPREVTRREWRELMGSPAPSFPDVGDDHPVEFITWYDALAFCNALSAARGLRPAYEIQGRSVRWDESADGYRLPTEAEWEFAARAHGVSPAEEARLYAAIAVIDRRGPAPVASLKPNAAGLYDMIGNVAEWCWDVFLPYDTDSSDYEQAKLADERAVRGGSWYAASAAARSSARGSAHPLNRLRGVGLRLARNASSQ
jgi:formylglycine-generating enzyme required for sulfatase activity